MTIKQLHIAVDIGIKHNLQEEEDLFSVEHDEIWIRLPEPSKLTPLQHAALIEAKWDWKDNVDAWHHFT